MRAPAWRLTWRVRDGSRRAQSRVVSAPRLPLISAVRGVSFHADAVSAVHPGDRVLVVHDPENPYDPNACAVLVHGELVGHLPAALAARMVSGPDRSWSGAVDDVIAGDHPTALRIRLESPLPPGGSGACDETALPEAAGPDASAGSDSDASPAVVLDVLADVPVMVRSRSGRVLGALAGQDDLEFRVDTGEHVISYPRSLAVLGD